MTDQPRRGRRPAGQSTRSVVLDAARAEFDERGYEAVSLRGVARRAGVDPGTVRHWFTDKAELFAATLGLVDIDPSAVARAAADGPVEGLGERLVRSVTQMWDADGGATVRVVVPAIMADPGLRTLLQHFLGAEVLGPIVRRLEVSDAELRSALAGSQVAGLMMLRYVVGVEPVASLPADDLAVLVGPNLQRYLTGDLPPVPPAR
ncbi:TetR family transcriptional regulator [Isoptericola chiayiensis]|uniref:TetR family transcriptional regulator n=1 Tax=Isoptericola chiayiensis TaxID=579446 RepID=A0ABP8YBG1_9MICO|nr:TetR family transcriptional regulator [Isoptericola chiayiensis]NOW02024.1 AcrR family transcriptional regulator [Isoptericola chiayiensis]